MRALNLPAFPQGKEWMDEEGNMRFAFEGGMTLRDYFAGQAMLLKSNGRAPRAAADDAYEYADAMLARRKTA